MNMLARVTILSIIYGTSAGIVLYLLALCLGVVR